MKIFWSTPVLERLWRSVQGFMIGILTMVAVLGFQFHAQAAQIGGNPNVNLSTYQAGTQSSYTVTFNATSGIPASGRVDVTFNPTAGSNANISSASLNLAGSSSNLGTATGTIVGNTIQVNLGADGNVIAGQDVAIQFDAIINAQVAQNYTVTLSTYDNLGTLIDGPTNSNAFTIQPRAPNTITLSPLSPQNVSADVNQLFITATVTDEFGNNVINGTIVYWQSSNPNFSFEGGSTTITSNGQTTVTLNTPTLAGETTTITASSGVVSDPYIVTVVPGGLHHINITPNTPQTITAGQTIQFTAQGYDEYNNPISGLTYSWSNAADGLFNNTTAGNYEVYAYIGAIESTHVNVTVNAGPTTQVNINPNTTQNITAGTDINFTASTFDVYGNPTTDQLIWTGTASSTSGLFNNRQTGSYTVYATANGVESTHVTVNVAPNVVASIIIEPSTTTEVSADIQQITVTATLRDQYGNLVADGTVVSWTRSNPAFTLSNPTSTTTNGLATIILTTTTGAGDLSTVTATSNGINATSGQIIVVHGALHHFGILAPANVTASVTFNIIITAYDQYNNIVTDFQGEPILSGLNDSPQGDVPDYGGTITFLNGQAAVSITGYAAGNQAITAIYDGTTGTSNNINFAAGNLFSMVISTTQPTDIIAGQTVQFSVNSFDQYGNARSGDIFTWTNTDANGLFTNTTVGIYAVQAHSDGIDSNVINVTVNHAQAVSVSINPPSASLTADQTQQFTATATDQYGNSWDISDQSTWSTTDPGGCVGQEGLYEPGQAGDWQVSFTYNGLSASASVHVTPGVLAFIEIQPDTAQTIIAGETIQFIARGYDSDGNEIPGLVFSWNNANNGLFDNTQAGTYTVYAYIGTIQSNQVSIQVNPAVLDHINILPNTPQIITAGQTIQFTAQGYDQYHNAITGLTYSWNNATAGLFNTTIVGNYLVYAYIGGVQSNTVSVQVNHAAVDHLIINPTNVTLINADQSRTYTVTAYDQYGNSWDVTSSALYTTTDPKGTFSGSVYHAGKVGTWIITASYQGQNISTNVTIAAPGAPATVQLTNASDSIETNSIYQFRVKIFDADGNEITNPTLAWSVTQGFDDSVIDQFGRFVAIKAGTYTVKAQCQSATLTFTFTVKDKSTASVSDQGTSTTTSATPASQTIPESTRAKSSIAATTTPEPEKGEIKGTEVTTIGPENDNEEQNGLSAGMVAFWVVLGLAVLGFAYYAYTIWGTGQAIESVAKPKTAEKAEKDNKKIVKDDSSEIKGIDEIKDDNLRW